MPILKVGDDGMLRVPGELLGGAQPESWFELEVVGDVVVLRPAGVERPFWRRATPGQRADAFQQWANTPLPEGADLPAESLRRESFYD